MKKKERIRILEQEVERLKIQYATLLAEVNRIQFGVRPAFPDTSPPYSPPPVWPGRGYEIWCQDSSDTIADAARSDA